MPTTLMCATQIHSGDIRTYVSVGEIATPTMPNGYKIGTMSATTIIEPPSQNRDTVTKYLEVDVLSTRPQNPSEPVHPR